jgi:folate-dependent tRNA-U54 methylase TrmFO/GidA
MDEANFISAKGTRIMKITKQTSVKFAGVVVGVAGFMGSMAGALCAADEAKPADYYTADD